MSLLCYALLYSGEQGGARLDALSQLCDIGPWLPLRTVGASLSAQRREGLPQPLTPSSPLPCLIHFQANKQPRMLPKSLLNAPSQRDLVYESVERVYGGAVDGSTSQMIYQRKCYRGTVNHHRERRGPPPSFCWQGRRQPSTSGS